MALREENKERAANKKARRERKKCGRCFRCEISLAGGETIPGVILTFSYEGLHPCVYNTEEGPIVTQKSVSRRPLSAGIRQSVLQPPFALLASRAPVSSTSRLEPPPFVPTSARQPLCSLLITLLYHPNLMPGPVHTRLGYGLNTVDREVQSHPGCTKAFTDCQCRKLANSSQRVFFINRFATV